jgi:hypothetical protein
VPIAITFGLETNQSFMDPFPIGIWYREKVGEIRNLYFQIYRRINQAGVL